MLRLAALFNTHRPRGRLMLSIAGIALGVALGYAVHLVNRAAVADVTAAVRALAGEADIEVRGGRTGFAESLFSEIAKLPGVRVASPLLAPDNAFLSASAATALGLGKGDRLRLVVGQHPLELAVAGVLPEAALRGEAALVDIATAQWRFDRLGQLNRVDVRLARGADRDAMLKTIQGLLPPGAYAAPVETLEQASAYPSRAYRVNLNVLALVALFTGGFLVFSAQALETARRRGEHALLRVLGLQRRGVTRLVLIEAAALGVMGAAIGIVLGYAFAAGAVRVLGADLGSGAFRGLSPELG